MRVGRTWLPVLVAGAVLATVVGVTLVVRLPGRPAAGGVAAAGGGPPVLYLRNIPPRGEPTDQIRPGLGGYRLVGPLPDGPAAAAGYRLSAGGVTESDVRRLAAALGLAGPPRRVAGGWAVDGGGSRLVVSRSAAGGWVYGPADCVSIPIGNGARCALSIAAPPPPAGLVRRRLASLLAAAGGPWAPVQVSAGTGSANPLVAGTPTSGLGTWLTLDPAGRPVQGAGWLARVAGLGSYPIVDAKTAFARLARPPGPRPLMCPLIPAERGCLPDRPQLVTGATLGLSFEPDRAGAVLLPAWLLHLRGSPDPVAVLAVLPRYLAPAG